MGLYQLSGMNTNSIREGTNRRSEPWQRRERPCLGAWLRALCTDMCIVPVTRHKSRAVPTGADASIITLMLTTKGLTLDSR